MLGFYGNPNHYLRSNIRNDMRKSDTSASHFHSRSRSCTHVWCRSFTFGFRFPISPLPSTAWVCVCKRKELRMDLSYWNLTNCNIMLAKLSNRFSSHHAHNISAPKINCVNKPNILYFLSLSRSLSLFLSIFLFFSVVFSSYFIFLLNRILVSMRLRSSEYDLH